MWHAWERGEVLTGFSLGGLERKRPVGRSRLKCKNNIKMDLREIGIGGANWTRLAQDSVQWWAFVSTVMNLRVPQRKQDVFDKLSNNQLLKYPVPWCK
jgi:hypothetical protein